MLGTSTRENTYRIPSVSGLRRVVSSKIIHVAARVRSFTPTTINYRYDDQRTIVDKRGDIGVIRYGNLQLPFTENSNRL